ncbi:AIPR family protein [Chelativorans sp. M5D2P16]|uniref:AIPR family protein n=1 Tax=Chelativorans sp. M5D2P16 TaxID=3095678 RepID=UPI002ACA439B|nr:AIPR family protein [Chelativorans sp. M5D2P16]MDZ5698641.1 AIPR family protein [Chelativorans sp. M5D2P16]
MNDDVVVRFARELATDVEEGLSADAPFSANIFTRIVLERLEDAGHLDSVFDLHQEGRLGNAGYRIDGFAFDEERGRLELFTTVYRGELQPSRLTGTEAARALERALRFASACMDGLADRLEPSNTDASDLARRIEAEAATLSTIRIVLLTDSVLGGTLPPSGEWKGRTVEYDAYDVVRLQRVLGEGETRADISVDLVALTGEAVPCLHVPSDHGGYEAYLAVLPGRALSQIYERYGVRLLELNVRAFLGLRGRKSVNSELRRTIMEQPSMFLAFNNGIVATADGIELDEANGRPAIRSLQGLQIVNGGQTTASLHRARRKESITLDHVAVPVKIIKVGGADLSEMVASISRAANRQNTVQLADFSANDPFHQQLETLANNTWLDDGKGRWFYERTRGSYLAAEQKASYRKTEHRSFRLQTPKQRRINKLDVARYLSAWSGLPHRVCLGGQKNFQHFMQRLKDEPPPPSDTTWFKRIIAIAILYRAVERTVRAMKFPAYGAQIIAYLVAAISHRTGGRVDFDRIWAHQVITPELENLVKSWAPAIDAALRESAGQRNPSEWFKKEECWTLLRERLPALSDPLPAELSYVAENGNRSETAPAVSVEDYDRIARCMEINGATWLEIAELGQRAGIIHWKVAGICRTLASYAAGGWERKPSAKQAKPALDAYRNVERAGIISGSQASSENVEQ